MKATTLEWGCRMAAIAIVVLALVDPVRVVTRVPPMRVALVPAAGATEAHMAQVRQALADTTVLDADAHGVDAYVIVGRLPPPVDVGDAPAFAVVPPASPDAPEIRRVQVRDRVPVDAVSQVMVTLAAAERPVTLTLLADGVPVDERVVDAGVASADLRFAPARAGVVHLRVTARAGEGPVAMADAAVEAEVVQRRVLVWDGRPSWASTFLRRALEVDPRFEVTVRTTTSRGAAVMAGAPPATLDRRDLMGMDVVVVSAPDVLDESAASALEAYARDHEGAMVLLPETDTGGSVMSRLTGITGWTMDRRAVLESVRSPVGVWTASEFVWPSTWPAAAEPMAACLTGTPRRCPVWRTPLGGGRVIVSSAIDGWRTRATGESAYTLFWRTVIGDEAAATPRPVTVTPVTRLVVSGAMVEMDIAIQATGTVPHAEWQNTQGTVAPVRVWPTADRRYVAGFRAPDVPGRYRLVVTNEQAGRSATGSAEFLVIEPGTLQLPLPATSTALTAWTMARDGVVVPFDELSTMGGRLRESRASAAARVPWHPMRSPWWIVPCAGLLAVEWWSRRRRGAR